MKPDPPLILISPQTEGSSGDAKALSSSLSQTYATAVASAGGTPVILPCLPDPGFVRAAVRRVDGVMLTGGNDVSPRLYARRLSKRVLSTVCLDGPERDALDLLLIQEVIRQRKPLLAICRGMQVLNVALGGTLIADIALQVPRAINHRRTDAKELVVHETTLSPRSFLAKIVGSNCLGVNSTHHQAVGSLAKVFRPSAVSRDGIVEGFELQRAHSDVLPFLIAVQFHPERLCGQYPEHLAIFQSFTAACRRNRQPE